MQKVKNIKNTADKKCNCGSWLQHWQNVTKKRIPPCCREIICQNKDLVGAHVIKVDSTDNDTYIVPLCQMHNISEEEIEIMDGYLVSANKSEICENK